MPTTVTTLVLRGLDVVPLHLTCAVERGIPGISAIGLPDAAWLESRATLRIALKASGLVPSLRAHVTFKASPDSLAPNLRSSTQSLELACAVALLVEMGCLPRDAADAVYVGGLTLDGDVRMTRGTYAFDRYAASHGCTLVRGEDDDFPVTTDEVRVVSRLADLCQAEASPCDKPEVADGIMCTSLDGRSTVTTLAQAARDGKNVLVIAPATPGATMTPDDVAQAYLDAMGPLDDQGRDEVKHVASVCGTTSPEGRPLRDVPSCVSTAGVLGGGRPVMPGEVTLASHGILLVRDVQDVSNVLARQLAQAIRERVVRIVRADGTYAFPADTTVIGVAPPCPCGHFGDPHHQCTCSCERIMTYRRALAGTGLFDVCVNLPA